MKRQQQMLDQAADDMMDRFVLLVPFAPAMKSYDPPLDAPYVQLSALQMTNARQRFHIDAKGFAIILLGEDGSEKLRSSVPVTINRLNALIDSMPGRKAEQQRPHAN